jgi:hypothetical protein
MKTIIGSSKSGYQCSNQVDVISKVKGGEIKIQRARELHQMPIRQDISPKSQRQAN